MKNLVPAEAHGDASTGDSGDGLSLRQALFREQHSYGLMVTASDGTITDWNPAAARIFGYSAEEVLGKTPAMFHRPEERPTLTASILASVEREGYWAGETHIVRRDGSEGITDTVVFSFLDEQGRPATIGINRDITEGNQVQKALRESVERLQLITDNVAALIVYFDADQCYRFVNEAAVELLGRPREHIIGKRIADLIDEDTYRKLVPHIERALSGEEVTFEGGGKAPNGHPVILQSNYLPHIDEQGRVLGCYGVSVDITEHKRVETEARGNENRLRLITDNVAATIVYFDADQRYQFVNKATEGIYGRPRDEILGRTLLDVQGEAAYRQIALHVQTALGGAEVTFEQERTSADGRRRNYQTTYLPDIDHDGEVIGVYVVLADITERKQAEIVLQDSEQRLRLITDNIPANVIYIDRERRYQFVNKSVEELYSLPHDEIVGKHAREIQGSAMYREVGPYIERALGGEEVVFEQARIARDGSPRNYQSIYLPHIDESGQVLGCYALSVDITGRTRTEAELKENEQRLRLITNNVPGNIFYVDAGQRYQFVNKGTEEMFGLAREDIIGKRISDIQDPAVASQVIPYTKMALAGQKVTYEIERTGPDGTLRSYQSTCLPHFAKGGEVVGCYVLNVDVTERKQAETEARENEARLRLVTDNVGAVIVYFDAGQRYRFVNKTFEDLHGLPAEELIGKRVAEIVGEPGYRELQPHIEAALEGKQVTFEQVRTPSNGSERTFHSTYLPHIDGSGQVVGCYALLVDITKRVVAERELRKNELRLRLISDNMPGHFIYFDAELRYRYVNKSVADQFGMTREEIIGKHPWETQDVATLGTTLPNLRRALGGEQVTFELRRTAVDGTVRDFQATYLPHVGDDGQVFGVYVMSVDITQRKRAEAELQRTTLAAELLRKIAVASNRADNPDDAIQVCLDEVCAYIGWSVGHACRFGPDGSGDLVSTSLWHLDDPTQYEQFRRETERTRISPGIALAGQVLAHAKPSWMVLDRALENHPRVQARLESGLKSGFAVPVMMGRQVAAVLEFFTEEVVERNQHLLEITTQVGVLIGRVIERQRNERNLLDAKEEAELASRSKTEFLANMSHELRTPLNAIIGFSEIINKGTQGEAGDATHREYAGHIYDSGQHLLTLINDILDISKIETGNNALYEERLEVAAIVESCMVMVRERADSRGLTLNVEMPAPALPALYADARRIKQVVINLLSNAVKFTEAGGTVTVKTWYDSDSGVFIQVVDTGIGISVSDIPKALGRFQQVDSDLNRKYQGTGLGLPLAKAMAEQHGGSLDLQSQVGVGTTVTVRLPAERVLPS